MNENKIFQHNSYHSLRSGFYKGTIALSEALRHGSIGIGTLDGANGEVIILDGVAYHGDANNQVRQVGLDDNETLPYVAVLDIKASDLNSLEFENLLSDDLYAELAKSFSNYSLYGIKITGNFRLVEIMSKPAHNTAPYEEILEKQPHFKREKLSGTMVGIWGPRHLESLYGSGYHLHFLSDDKSFGAHVERFIVDSVKVEFVEIDKIEQEFDFS
ncbi:MAG: acetolactate decarboxylase [Streptococcaceae bacterium]|jgi:acetolactate decarboxylase|nr:acetolactate decarboxylase [Streptococcaceae bacterium]